jgi:2-dehydropantoate 2-reductase
MKILMVGAGAVGGYFGALLHRSGADLTFLVRERTSEIIQKRGLIVESVNGNMTIQPKVARAGELNSTFDLIILAVKCYDLEEVFKEIKPAVGTNTLIMTLQNGVDTEDRMIPLFGRENIIGGVAFITSKRIERGRIAHYKRGIITIGELNGTKSGRLVGIHKILTDSGIPAYMTSEIMKKKWEKLCWNATFNPLSVLLDGPASMILESPGGLSAVRQAIEEIIGVAKANGFQLKEKIAEDTIQASYELKDYHTSMYEDWKSGNLTENEHLNGAVYRKGVVLDIPTPMNFIFYQAIKAMT